MIVREWRAQADDEGVSAYHRHFRDVVLPGLWRLQGFVGAGLFRRKLSKECNELVVHTRWRSLAAIEAFTGPNIDKAVVEPAAAMVLLSWHSVARHYDLLEETVGSHPASSGH
jgi:heme-degrading monooxygenase HmoA